MRLRGRVETVPDAEADAYFATRLRAWRRSAPGRQSDRSALESRLGFEKAIARCTAKFAIGTVPRPPHWVGYRVVPSEIEFWQERQSGCTNRIAFARERIGAPWTKRDSTLRSFRLEKLKLATKQPAAPYTPSHRGEPRYRPCHGEAVFRRRLARHHLLAPSVPGELSLGSGPGGSHPVDLADPENTEAAIAETKQRLKGELHALVNNAAMSPKAAAASGLARSKPPATIGTIFSRSISSHRSCWPADCSKH